MPVPLSYPGIYIEELPSSARTITPAPTSITVFVGYTHPFQGECAARGLWGQAIQIFNFTEYERVFGGLYRSTVVKSHVADAVYQFFLNGGTNAYVVGLQPKYYTAPTLQAPLPTFIKVVEAASGAVGGIKFTAKHLTEATNKVSITIRNLRQTGTTANNTADILITHGSRLESYPNVLVKSGLPAGITDANFIDKRLASSAIVKVEPADTGTKEYLDAYTTASPAPSVISLDLADMPLPTVSYTTFRAKDITDVFADEASLDKVDIFNLLVIPGVSDNGIWSTALHFCERKLAFYVMDAPQDATADGMGIGLTQIKTIVDHPSMPRFSANGALYFPFLKTIDPLSSTVLQQPPSGFVAGIYARTDTRRGVWKAPAGLEASILNTTGVVEEGRMTDMRQGVLNPLGVNVLRSFPGSGTVIWGARSVGINGALQQWRYVPVRRTALFIEQTLLRNLGWVVFEPNDEPLWTAIRISIDGFMLSLFRQAAFQGSTPSQAFRVQCDATTTTQTDIDNGVVNIVVGFRPLKPAEFVVIKIAQLAGQVQ
jgi:phage tail sheath protein FI